MGAAGCARLAVKWLAVNVALLIGALAASSAVLAETDTATPHPSMPALFGEIGPTPSEAEAGAEPAPPVENGPLAPDCTGPADALGVSRVVEIDTSAGPRFGQQYLKVEPKFLEPGEVVLTFDDGPMRRYTLPILDALDEQCVKATFFSVGRMAVADPITLQEVVRRGHTIGVHTWSHKNLATLSAAAMKREFELGISAVAAAAGTPIAPFFRFPYLGHNKTTTDYIQSRGVGIFGIHVDSKDFRTKNPGVVLRNVMSQLEREKKGILLFHDIQPSTAGALSSLLLELKEHGYRIVHMVPKNAAATLPEYDAIASKMLAAKAVAAAKSPLADRAATWPIVDAPAAAATAAPPVSRPRPAKARAPAAKPFDWANPGSDPSQQINKPFGD
jgi:peptidoglycan/xylan/chitin deacetylase (PgdA/CDA1 family)